MSAIMNRLAHPTLCVAPIFQSATEFARRLRESASINRRLPLVTQMLGEAGVARVYLQYQGAEAGRRLTKLRFLSLEDDLITPALSAECRATLIRFLNELIDTRLPRWGSTGKSFGDVIWDLAVDIVIHGRALTLPQTVKEGG